MRLAILLMIGLCTSNSLFAEDIKISTCKKNAETLAYSITMKHYCGIPQKTDSEFNSYLIDLNKKCMSKYGRDIFVQIGQKSVLSAKAQVEKQGPDTACDQFSNDYADLL